MSVNPDDLPGADQQMFPLEHVQELRHEAAAWRIKARDAEAKLAQVGEAPAKLAKAQAEIRDLKVGQAFTDTALRLGANPRLTRATLQMDGHLTGLDPDKADFLPALESLIKTALAKEPELKGAGTLAPPPAKVGSDITHPNTSTPLGREVSRADLAGLKAAGREGDIATLYKTGQLDHLLKGSA